MIKIIFIYFIFLFSSLNALSNIIDEGLSYQIFDAEKFADDDKNSLLDIIPDNLTDEPDKELHLDSLRDEVQAALSTLKDREKDVIKMYFGIDYEYALTLNEIGEEFGLTRERVRQIKEKAIRRLRHRSRSKKLRSYLG